MYRCGHPLLTGSRPGLGILQEVVVILIEVVCAELVLAEETPNIIMIM